MKFQDYIPFYRRNLTLALPIVLSQIGQVTVSLADNMMVGHVGTTELAAASFANSVFMIGMVFGMGVTMGLTPLVGKAFGQNQLHKAIIWLKNGIAAHLTASVALTALMFSIYFFLPYMGQPENVLHLARPYYLLLCSSYLPFMFFFTLKQFFEGIGNTKIAMQITLIANVINIVVNYVFIFGKFGFPEMGLMGAGIGTVVSRMCMPLLFAWFILRNNRYKRYFVFARYQKIFRKDIVALLRIGIPIGFQLIVEVAAFAIGAVMMGWLGETQLAAHQVALGLATFTYMISLGISQANTIRVSHQMGDKDYVSLRRAVFASTHLVLLVMSLSALLFIVSRKILPLLFTSDENVIQVAATLLIIAAVFQLFDGLQVIMQSSLRGMADVTTPMLIAFIAYLLIGIPTSYIFTFVLNAGPQGIWYGYLVGLGTAGVLFYIRFMRLLKRLG
ncbi:multidrug resistance protein, MATE family [Draconibacterium orientale]|uniref:Multidrug-efflux transporter n=1 Tax=Draconibacterium orientale TaxID=1168034 RepID=X5E2T7_9BACT|nr:MATE family efflux transporter [Draconibacterium orientale]AHW60921.1 multidrug transporter MATE [Draconibacterium orientale]SES63891.1 multidrug resistance protein, MATE family [Draconibacterium orientale]